jgi:hypothetical protein
VWSARIFCIVVAMLVIARPARAEGERVEVAIVGSEEAIRFVEDPLRASFASLPVTVTTTAAETLDVNALLALPSSSSVARIWVDVRSAERIAMFLADRSGQRILLRQVARAAPDDVVAREELLQILESSVEALLAGGQIGVEREEARRALGLPEKTIPPPAELPPPQEPVPAPLPKAEPGGVGFFFGYHALLWSQYHPLHGPLAGAELVEQRFSISFQIEPRFPRRVDGDVVSMDVFHVALRVMPWYSFQLSEPATLAFGFGPGLDIQRSAAVEVPGSTAKLAEPATALIPVVRAAAAVDLAQLRFGLGLDLDLVRTEYIVTVNDDRQRAFVPWRLHPVVFGAFRFGP